MEVSFRKATAADSDLIADLVFGEEGDEGRRVAAAVMELDDVERMRPLFRTMWRSAENWRYCELLLVDGKPSGVLQSSTSSVRITPAVIFAAFRALGLRTLTVARRMRVYDRVSPEKPEGAYVVSEVHVLQKHRGKGLGTRLMARAEEQARAGGYKVMALQTRTNNPARRLYERCGYKYAGEATDPEFERLTGVPGNVLYVKRLDDGPVSA